MFWNDHAPPHFHAYYGEYNGIIDINLLKMLESDLPRRALNLIIDWAELHQKELLADWAPGFRSRYLSIGFYIKY